MATKSIPRKSQSSEARPALSEIVVEGFKSLRDRHSVEVRPLTILAGANSSGKSSLIQPLLLLKQTLEASFDPGPLLLNGPNVKFTSTDQILSCTSTTKTKATFSVGIAAEQRGLVHARFKKARGRGFEVAESVFNTGAKQFTIRPRMSRKDIEEIKDRVSPLMANALAGKPEDWNPEVVPRAFFFDLQFEHVLNRGIQFTFLTQLLEKHESIIQAMIHVPGLRGNPERNYSITAVGNHFPGTFEKYTASVIAEWQNGNSSKLERLCHDLQRLGLTWTVSASYVNDTQVELQVGRLPTASGSRDLVNLSDVGIGVSQSLPVLVALYAAKPGQTIYVEQPELHLHPRAQTILSEVIADAVKQGARVIAETHSSAFLLGVQTCVAEGKLPPEMVKLHWFQRKADGATEIISGELDEAGAFGDWPEDFADVALYADHRYLKAAHARLR